LDTLKPVDFPLAARDQHIYRSDGAVLLGPMPDSVARDIVDRLNRDAVVQAAADPMRPEPHKVMLVGPNLGPYPADSEG
jgi:hypothetical protein